MYAKLLPLGLVEARKRRYKSQGIKMNRNLLAASLLAIAVIAPMTAQASDGTLTFAGALSANTCTITAPASFTVTLPTLPIASLAAAAATAGNTPFSLSLTACSAGVAGATMYFEAGANVNTTNGRLNATGTATGVQIQLRNSNGTVIDASKASGAQGTTVVATASNAATINYSANYYATAATTAGTVGSTVTYSVIYN